MQSRRLISTVARYLWGILVSVLVFAAGLVMSRMVFSTLKVSIPRMPGQAAETVAGYYLIAGSAALAIGLVPVTRRVGGTYLKRWLVLATFLYLCFAVNGPIEFSIHSSTEGALVMVPVLLLPCVLITAANACLFMSGNAKIPASVSRFFSERTLGQWTWRLSVVVVSFPALYFFFRVIASSLLSGGPSVPDAALILPVQLLRGFLVLLATFPVLIVWSGSRRQLFHGLTLAFFVCFATYDVILAHQTPLMQFATQLFERLASSLVFACILVTLLTRRDAQNPSVQPMLQSSTARAPGAWEGHTVSGGELESAHPLKNCVKADVLNLKTTAIVVVRIAFLTLILLTLCSIDFLGLRWDAWAIAAPFAHLLMAFLNVLALSYPIMRSRWTGRRLVVTVFFVLYGVMTFLSQIETVVFLQYLKDVVPAQETPKLFLNGAIVAALFSPLIVWIHGKMSSVEGIEQASPRLTMPLLQWARKMASIGLVYVVIYFAFGAFVAMPIGGEPFQQLYGNLQMPVWFIPFQLIRGMIWAALAIPVVQMMKGSLAEAGLAVALLFSVLITSLLLPPNEYMPDQVRVAHIVEVASSNFLFGWIAVWILGQRQPHRTVETFQ